jgi:hypothetical protein
MPAAGERHASSISRSYRCEGLWMKIFQGVKLLKVDFDEIQKAMEDVVRDSFDYFLDLRTGEVIVLSEDILDKVGARLYDGDFDVIGDDIEYIEFSEEPILPSWMEDEVELVMNVILEKNGRYDRIPERQSTEAHQVMLEFLETVEEPVLREELAHALDGKGAFRRFKDILRYNPQERKKWHGHNARAMKKVITEWLKPLEIEPVQINREGKERGQDDVGEVEL